MYVVVRENVGRVREDIVLIAKNGGFDMTERTGVK